MSEVQPTSTSASVQDPIDDGGPAFPVPPGIWTQLPGDSGSEWSAPERGMSLREWYAGLALQGIIACPGTSIGADGKPMSASVFREAASRAARLYADALIAELRQR